MFPTSIGLYYPFINFRNENWLKVALLYWDRISRIIPRTYDSIDSDAVQRVRGELDAIVDSHPDQAPPAAMHEFRELLLQEARALRNKYAVSLVDKWKPDPTTIARARHDRGNVDRRFAYVFDEKFGHQIVPLLLHEGLGRTGEGHDVRWIGMHPDLAGIYMTLLAEGIAKQRGFRLLSDSVTRHISIGDFTAARLAHIALGRRAAMAPRPEEFEQAVALTAIRAIVPKNLDDVSIDDIIKLRKKYRNELREFQNWIQGLAESLGKQAENMNWKDLRVHLSILSEKDIEPRMADLSAQLKTLGIESATSVVNVKTIAGSGIFTALAQPFLGASWISFSAATQLAKHQREAKKLVASNPAAYLVLAKEKLNSGGVVKKVASSIRRFSLSK